MLKSLLLSNIVLVEAADIPFCDGFNVLSGETGAGKSAVMAALCQIAGARADANLVRHGADKGVIEASFDITQHPHLSMLLLDAGIDHSAGEDLIIRREVSSQGKSRAFVNNQLASLNLLKQVGENLVEIVGQHANQQLKNLEHHRKVVDLFGELEAGRRQFKTSWDEENLAHKELETLVSSEAQRLREIEVCRMEIEELGKADVHEGEEEALFAEYTRLANAEELARLSDEVSESLSGDGQAVLPAMYQQQKNLEQLVELDPSLQATLEPFNSALLELEEVSQGMRNYRGNIEFDPTRTEEVNDRLGLLNRLKRKYGPSVEELLAYYTQTTEKLERLENASTQVAELEARLKELEDINNARAADLTAKRKQAGQALAREMNEQIKALNMPKAVFYTEISPQKRSRSGDDKVEFMFAPNTGEKKISIRECASGGELSRLMLALQTLLAGKENTPTLVFDEIDANIGGETAVVVGEKLRALGERHQVLCITHFAQVAQCAAAHLEISKREIEGRTITQIEILDDKSRERELSRMMGQGYRSRSKTKK